MTLRFFEIHSVVDHRIDVELDPEVGHRAAVVEQRPGEPVRRRPDADVDGTSTLRAAAARQKKRSRLRSAP